jgi:hypothetical protein
LPQTLLDVGDAGESVTTTEQRRTLRVAPMVGASLDIMQRDRLKMRGERPWVFTNIKERQGLDLVAQLIVRAGMLEAA